jgi:hypothetical protein
MVFPVAWVETGTTGRKGIFTMMIRTIAVFALCVVTSAFSQSQSTNIQGFWEVVAAVVPSIEEAQLQGIQLTSTALRLMDSSMCTREMMSGVTRVA